MIGQVLSAAKFSLLRFRRNPAATTFTMVFPLVFLVAFGLLFRDNTLADGASVASFQVPGILTMSIVSATFFNLAMGLVVRRESGELKRLRSTPVRPLVWILGQILGSFVIVILMTVLVTAIGRYLFSVTFNWFTIGPFALAVFLGSATFCALGMAVTVIIPNVEAAPAITNLILFPLYFVSDVFIVSEGDSGFMGTVGDFFPVKPLANLLQPTYDPFASGATIEWSSVLTLSAWGAVAVLVASRFFRWTAQHDRG